MELKKTNAVKRSFFRPEKKECKPIEILNANLFAKDRIGSNKAGARKEFERQVQKHMNMPKTDFGLQG